MAGKMITMIDQVSQSMDHEQGLMHDALHL